MPRITSMPPVTSHENKLGDYQDLLPLRQAIDVEGPRIMRSSCSEETILEETSYFHGELPVPMSMGLCPFTELSSLYSMIDEDCMEREGLEWKGCFILSNEFTCI